jgi:ribonuclease-3
MDSAIRLLKAIAAPQVEEVEKQRQDVLRLLSQEQARQDVRSPSISPAEEARLREKLKGLLQCIPFQNAYLLNQALTHRSYKYENPNTGEDNEQLEFLGDALLTFLSGDFLYKNHPRLKEGNMTVLRSNLVDGSQLAKFALELDLGQWMQLGRGVDMDGGREKTSLLSNTFEAVIGAYYLDSGVEAVRSLVNPFFEQAISILPTTEDASPQGHDDVKGRFQQVVLDPAFPKNPKRKPPTYETERTGGTDDDPQFVSAVYVHGTKYGVGKAGSKKEAEKHAAEDALKKLRLL